MRRKITGRRANRTWNKQQVSSFCTVLWIVCCLAFFVRTGFPWSANRPQDQPIKTLSETIVLSNGKRIPRIGLGTWKASSEMVSTAVKFAISVAGYKHIDCASRYGNQKSMPFDSLFAQEHESRVKREDVYITSKLWNTNHGPGDVMKAMETTLKDLKLSYVDLYLMHWPVALYRRPWKAKHPQTKCNFSTVDWECDDEWRFDVSLESTWAQMEALVYSGRTRSIGVSNFNVNSLKRLMKIARIKPVVNQIELHPYLIQSELMDFCRENNIQIVAYCPIGSPGNAALAGDHLRQSTLIHNPIINRIASIHKKSPAQIILRWALQQDIVVIPKSTNLEHIQQNIDVYNFYLDAEDMSQINSLQKAHIRYVPTSHTLFGRRISEETFWNSDALQIPSDI